MRPHWSVGYYDALDRTSKLEVPSLSLREVAEKVNEMQRGTHRLLSHLIDVRREALQQLIVLYKTRGDDDIAYSVQRRGDRLAEAIEKLLIEQVY